MELSPFSSEVYALLPVLSTLLDNPGDFRLWTVSPCLYIRVWYLPDNRQNCYFLYTRFSNNKISNILHCLSYCRNVFPSILVWYWNLSNNVAKYELFMCYIHRSESMSFFGTKDVICCVIWRHLPFLLVSVLNIWWCGGLTALYCTYEINRN